MAYRTHTPTRSVQVAQAALAGGFIALAFGVLQADAQQAVAYELSIYGGTPDTFWVGVAIAFTVALVISLATGPGRIRTLALLLGGMATAAVAALPLIRGYYYNGTADAMTHLGWTKEIASGGMAPTELFYPGIHTFATVFTSLSGVAPARSMLLVVPVMALITIVFVPLTVRAVSTDPNAVVFGAFSAFLMFMVHNLGIYLHAHAFAQATFFSALVLFLVFVYLTRGSSLAVGTLLGIVTLSVVLFHPQQALNLILVFLAISLVQFFHRRRKNDHPIAHHHSLYAHTVVLAVAFALWVSRFEGWAFSNLDRVAEATSAYLAGQPPTAGGSVQTQATSLTAIGSGLPEIFVKLFLVAAIYTVLSGVLVAAAATRSADNSRSMANATAIYLGLGAAAVLTIAAVYFLGNIAEHYFRHLGFLFLIGTILGAIALSRGVRIFSAKYDARWVTIVVVLAFAVMLPLSLATVFPSPFMHKQTQHVTEPQMDGYQLTFEINNEALPLGGIRQAPWRYSHVIEGVSDERRPYRTTVTNDDLPRLASFYEDGGYLVVTDRDRAREVVAYGEVRYTDRAFQELETQPGVDRVVSNGAFRLYHVSEGGG